MNNLLRNVGLRAALLMVLLQGGVIAGEMKAGVGRVAITPKQNMWMAGYASRKAPADGKVHELWAKALAIEDESGARSVIVTTDLLGLPAWATHETAERAKKKFGIERARLMLTSSHTHCGPVIRGSLASMYPLDEKPDEARLVDAYSSALPGLLVEAIGQAIGKLEPCALAWGVGTAEFAANRRVYKPQTVSFGVNPIGPVDHDVPVLRAARKDGSVIAVLVGYACHNTTLSFQKFCGDYAGFAQADLEEAIPGAAAMFVMGCGGDQNPNPRDTIELAQKHGRELADAVQKVLKGPMSEVHGPIRGVYKEIPLALSEPPTREALEKQTKDANIYAQRRAKNLLAELDAKGKLGNTYPYPIQVWQFADTLQMIALGGEVVVDYSLRLKHELGHEKNFVIGYANDVMAYIPSLRILKEGGYEGGEAMVYYGLFGPWTADVEKSIIKEVHTLVGK